MKKIFFKKSLRGQKLLQFAKNRLESLIHKANSCSNFLKKVTTMPTIVVYQHFFLLQFHQKLLQFHSSRTGTYFFRMKKVEWSKNCPIMLPCLN